MSWQWNLEGDGQTHVWAASQGPERKISSFASTPTLVYYHRWMADFQIPDHIPVAGPLWEIHGPPNGDGYKLPSQWELV